MLTETDRAGGEDLRDKKRYPQYGRAREHMQHRSFAGVTNPFVLSDHSGVRYYDIDALDGGHLLVMLGNASWIADRQILIARSVAGDKDIEFPVRWATVDFELARMFPSPVEHIELACFPTGGGNARGNLDGIA